MKKYYMVKLQYCGVRYHGWQKQKDHSSIHQTFEEALKECVPAEVETHSMGASRTDARVHALGQVVKVTISDYDLEPSELTSKLNQALPFDIRAINSIRTHRQVKVILWAKEKEYIYKFHNSPDTTPWMYPYVVNFEEPLDIKKMQKAAKLFIGEHNFKNYCYRGTQVKETIRKVFECEIIEDHQLDLDHNSITSYALRIRGNGFLKQMVRIIMGTLVQVGNGTVTLEQVKESLKTGSTMKLGFISPPHGLFLKEIKYPAKHFDKEL
jgi:tRNA pseudouridine38-40 synthase